MFEKLVYDNSKPIGGILLLIVLYVRILYHLSGPF